MTRLAQEWRMYDVRLKNMFYYVCTKPKITEMKNIDLAKRVKEIRSQRGISQELFAEKSGLSLRTIQRIEKGETEPRGDTLKRLASALNVLPNEIIDQITNENKRFLANLNLSALFFILFPVLGVIIPLIMWVPKKEKMEKENRLIKEIINFQLLWSIIIVIAYIYFIGSVYYRVNKTGDISMSVMGNPTIKYIVFGFLYFYNLVMVVINSIKIQHENEVKYFPKIRFVK